MVVTGLSGGGKTAAAKLFEDLGYTVVDNLPGELLPELADLLTSDRERFAKSRRARRPSRRRRHAAYRPMRGALEGRGMRPQVVFLEARDEVLIRRFSETRHRHPLDDDQRGIANAIARRAAPSWSPSGPRPMSSSTPRTWRCASCASACSPG